MGFPKGRPSTKLDSIFLLSHPPYQDYVEKTDHFPFGDNTMRIGISSYSYRRMVINRELTQLEVIKKAKEAGFDVIEFARLTLPDGVEIRDFAKKIRDECDHVGMEIANYTIGADFINGYEGSGGDCDAEVQRLRSEIEIARILGVPGMRHDATQGFSGDKPGAKGFDDALPILAKGCREVTKMAADLGIKTMVENHGYFCQDSERVEKLVCAVNHPNFGVLVDMGNFVVVDEDPGTAVGRLIPYAFHFHAKDFHLKSGDAPFPGVGWNVSRGGNFWRGAIIGHGDVPVTQCIRTIKQSGYDGVLSIEFEGMEDVLTSIDHCQTNLRRFIDNIEQE